MVFYTNIGGQFKFYPTNNSTATITYLKRFADIATGLLAGGKHGELDSEVSYRGMRKKAMQTILVGLTAYLGSLSVINLPLGEGVAWSFCATEVLSVIENAARLGVTMPDPVVAALKRLGSTQQGGQA